MEQTEEHTEEHVDEPADEPDEPTVDRNDRKERIGVVESAKMDKSITVSVRRQMKHPMYGKYLERSSTFMAHDEEDEARRLVEIIERAK
ncbi:MAG: 30S ribosomal protein S17 [Bacteroidetes bacterium QH_1_64_81]|nr:MAG: 30S ribosomal protein S17 [Bacteroidetes bacterium QH_1_64_81]